MSNQKLPIIFVAVVCVTLLVSLLAVSVSFVSIIGRKDLQLSNLEAQKSDLNSQLSELTSLSNNKSRQISDLQNQITSLDSQIRDLNTQVANLTSSTKLNTTELWLNDENATLQSGSFAVWNRTIDYPGYIVINKIGGGSTKIGGETSVQVTYWSDPVYFERKFVIGKVMPDFGGLAFPVLPTSNLEVRVEYDNSENATANIFLTVSYVH